MKIADFYHKMTAENVEIP